MHGIILIVAGVFGVAVQDALIKYSSSDFTLWQLYVLRSLIAVPILLFIIALKPQLQIKRSAFFDRWILLRSMSFNLMYISYYAAIALLPLSVLAAGFYLSPLFVALLSAIVLGDNIKPMAWLAIFLGFLGVMLILKIGTDAFNLYMLLPICAAFFYAVSAVLTRTKCQQKNPLLLVLNMNVLFLFIGLAFSALFYLWQPSFMDISPILLSAWSELTQNIWLVIIELAIIGIVAGFAIAKAYQIAPSVIIATFDYSYMIFATLLGYFIFLEKPDLITIIGMLLIAGAGLLVMRD